MNTLESTFCLLVLVSLLPLFFTGIHEQIDYSVYELKLAEDVWRILYLKNNFETFDKNQINQDLNKIHDLTSLCILFEEEDIASCIPNEASVVIKRVAFINGNPKIITIKMGVE